VGLGRAGHPLAPPVLDDRFRRLGPRPVEAVEGPRRKLAVEDRTVRRDLCLEAVEHALGQPARVGLGLHHQRRDRADQHGFCHAALTVPRDVAHDLAAPGGVPDVDRIAQIEMLGHGRQIVGVVIHVVTVTDLARASVTTPIVGDHAVAAAEEEQHLVVPVVTGERPSVAEDDRLARAPVLVEDLNAVGCGDPAHGRPLTSEELTGL
jgi:hypothetical protein